MRYPRGDERFLPVSLIRDPTRPNFWDGILHRRLRGDICVKCHARLSEMASGILRQHFQGASTSSYHDPDHSTAAVQVVVLTPLPEEAYFNSEAI
jgi:hypothetical protein